MEIRLKENKDRMLQGEANVSDSLRENDGKNVRVEVS